MFKINFVIPVLIVVLFTSFFATHAFAQDPITEEDVIAGKLQADIDPAQSRASNQNSDLEFSTKPFKKPVYPGEKAKIVVDVLNKSTNTVQKVKLCYKRTKGIKFLKANGKEDKAKKRCWYRNSLQAGNTLRLIIPFRLNKPKKSVVQTEISMSASGYTTQVFPVNINIFKNVSR